jgi:hypothetical protein
MTTIVRFSSSLISQLDTIENMLTTIDAANSLRATPFNKCDRIGGDLCKGSGMVCFERSLYVRVFGELPDIIVGKAFVSEALSHNLQ